MPKIAKLHVRAAEKETRETKDLYDQDEFDGLQADVAMLEGMLRGYAEHYPDDRREFRNAKVETRFTINMGDFDYSGSIDVAMPGRIMEHKTASNIHEHYIERLALDTQVRGYIAGAKYALGLKPREVLYNVTRKTKLRRKSNETPEAYCERITDDYMSRPDFYFWREPLRFSSSDIDAWEHEVRQVHREYQRLIEFGNQQFDSAADPRAWGIDDQACTAFFQMCPYHVLCTKSLDRFSELGYTQRETLHEELEDKEAA